jgi:acylphosphatase
VAEAARKTVRVIVEGVVQGIGFRYWTERNARSLGLDGWVRNRRDGTVEAVFSGPAETVDEMVRRCRQGPRGAEVKQVRLEEGSEPVDPGFATARTV